MVVPGPAKAFLAKEAALYAAKETLAKTWVGSPETLTIPEKMKRDRLAYLILQLPKVFKDNSWPLASAFMTSWLYGDKVQTSSLWRYRRFHIAELKASKTIAMGIKDALDMTELTVKQAAKESFSEPRWLRMKQFISAELEGRKRRKQVEDFTSDIFEKSVDAPEWVIGHQRISSVDYMANFELPSDAYASLAACAVNQYFRFRAYRDEGKICVKPLACGVRIEDSYDFRDDLNWDALIGLFLANRPSQFLGFFRESPTADAVTLTNSDFNQFSKYRGETVKVNGVNLELRCKDFKVYSDFSQRSVNIDKAEI